MTPQEAAIDGYAVIQSEAATRGQAILVSGEAAGGRPIVAAHPLDYIALAWPDPNEHLDRAIGWILGHAFARFTALEKRIEAA